jgi:uncharacterized membrane protein
MQKFWEGSVHVDAPLDEVWKYVGDFNRHPEWDGFTNEVELAKPGDANGIGAEWKVKEQLGMLKEPGKKNWFAHGAAPGRREVREVVPMQKIVWQSYPVPKMGVSAVFTVELAAENGGTLVRQTVQVNLPGVVDVVGRVLLPKKDEVQQTLWQENLEHLKGLVEKSSVREAVAV